MALAILDLIGFENGNVQLNIDTGTSRYYRLRIGESVEKRQGIDWVEEVVFTTPMMTNEVGGRLLNSSKTISIPATRFKPGHSYVQLFSFKDAQGKSPAFSSVLKVPVGSGYQGLPDDLMVPAFSMSTSMNTTQSFNPARRVPCRTCRDVYSRPASVEDLLAGIVRAAAPMVLNLLGGSQNGSQPGAAGGAATGAAAGAGSGLGAGGPLDLLASLLRTVLGSIPGAPAPGTSRTQSLVNPIPPRNRFAAAQSVHWARPFIFGIDDALLGTMIGPLISALPQLMNSANQQRLQQKQTNNKLITDILSEVNRRMMLDRLLAAQRQPEPGEATSQADMAQLLQLLQQAAPANTPAPAPAAAPPAAPPAATTPPPLPRAQSLSVEASDSASLSSQAMVGFVTADPISWNGASKLVFARNQNLQLKLQLKVVEPAPKAPLPKAIVKIVLQDPADKTVRLEKSFKQKDVLANNAMTFAFQPDELAQLPVNKPIDVLAEMRWLTKTGRRYKALGSTEIVLVNKCFLKQQGKEASPEKELTDMKVYRTFWNKVWESPSLDTAGRNGDQKYIWELNVNAKYSVLISVDHDANGLMQTKILRGQPDNTSLNEKTEGRLKGGVELSLSELNKLLPLWTGETALNAEKLEALKTSDFAKNNATEFIYNFKLKGRTGERGMIWVAPIFKLYELTLATITNTDYCGQVTAMSDETVRFPLPVAARLIGLKSK
jgi:hypothetical protein